MPGTCDPQLQSIFDVMNAGVPFANPYAGYNGALGSEGYGLASRILATLPILNPLAPDYADRVALLNALTLALGELMGSNSSEHADSPAGYFQAYSQFASGQMSYFPIGQLGPAIGGIPNIGVLGSMSFFGLMGVLHASKAVDEDLCIPPPPEDPCANVKGVFQVIMGSLSTAFTTVINLIKGLQNLVDINLGALQQCLDTIITFTSNIISTVVEEISKLIAVILKTSQYGMAKLLQNLDPCLRAVIEAIATPALINAIGPAA